MASALKVLLVEDDPNDAVLIERELEKTFSPVIAQRVDTAPAFTAALEADGWNVVIADHQLPHFNSTAALAALRATGRDIPFVIVSDNMKVEEAVTAMRAGADDYVLKSNLALLSLAVERELRETKVRRMQTDLTVSTRTRDLGEGIVLQSVVRDLPEERRARAALEYQALLLENLYDAVVALDAHLVITAWNRAAERLFGWAHQEAVHRPLLEVLPPSAVNSVTFQELCARISQEGSASSTIRHQSRSGKWIDIETRGVALRSPDGTVLGYVLVNHDITERKRVETALRASQEQIMETMSEGIWVLDAQGRMEFANLRATEMLGLSGKAVIGARLLDLMPSAIRPTIRLDLDAFARGEKVQHEIVLGQPDGSEISLLLSTGALRAPDASVVGTVAVLTDVTALRHAQDQLLQARKMEAVGRLAAGIAHDFNNLLSVIESYSTLLLESFPEGDERKEDAREIREAGDRAAKLVRQLLAFARKSPSRALPVTVNAIVRGMEKLLRRALGEDITVSVSLAPESWATLIDPGQLEQVILNLAVNARDAMPNGGQLRIETRSLTLERPLTGCESLSPGRYTALVVSDTGSGITPEIQSRIFEPFFTAKGLGKGTGLGLSTAYGIVEQVGGQIAVASELQRGTTFTVYLPFCEPKVEDHLTSQEESRYYGSGETVLLVEDENEVRRVTRRLLERRHFRVLEAGSANEALGWLQSRREPVNLVLSDVVMPGVSGTDMAATIGQLRPNVPILFMSGYFDREIALQNSSAVIAKPFTEESLAKAVCEALSRATRPGASTET